MEFIKWFLQNFGIFFGGLFLIYFFLILRRILILKDCLRVVPIEISGSDGLLPNFENHEALRFLRPYLKKIYALRNNKGPSVDAVIDAAWAEVDVYVTVHFPAINGYISSLILIGFAGTIFGAIGAFSEMFNGLGNDLAPAKVFTNAWSSGLSTALYTSLLAASIGGFVITVIYSRYLMTKAKRLESMVGLAISQVLEEKERS